jgi:hypothetical protein
VSFALYVLFVASNMATIFYLPNRLLNDFLATYSASSFFLGFAIVVVFSQGWVDEFFQRFKLFGMAALWTSFAVALITDSAVWLAASYAAVLIVGDYVISQGCSQARISIYRMVAALTVLPGVFGWVLWLSWLIEIRIAVVLVVLTVFGAQVDVLRRLAIRSALVYVGATSFFYYGLLMVISISNTGGALKIWYIGAQIGLSLQLKLMDFDIRKLTSIPGYIRIGVYVASATIPVMLFAINSGWINLILYYFAAIGLYCTHLFSVKDVEIQ